MSGLNESETYAQSTLGSSQQTFPGEQKVLGVLWKMDTDELVLSLEGVIQTAKKAVPSKRHVVSIIGRVYNPLEIVYPVMTPFKIFSQELCVAKIRWDEPLPEPLLKKWETLIGRLKPESCVTIPRCVKR